MSCAVAIFVKTPELSAVKSRLWPAIGRGEAERLHRASAAAVCSVVLLASRQAAISGYWALAESAQLSAMHWPGLSHVEQGCGSLGQRMAAVYRQLRKFHRGVILIGADAPQIQTSQLLDAAKWLSSDASNLAIGRASDGGFWLFGGNRDLADDRWSRARYSAPTTADEFVGAMKDCGDWLELETLCDLDTQADIETVHGQLRMLDDPTAEQSRVLNVLASLLTIAEPINE